MIEHRCPWCGEKIPFFKPFFSIFHTYKDPNTCPFCQRPYKSVNRIIEFVFAVLSLYCFVQVFSSLIVLLSVHKLENKIFIFLPILIILLLLIVLYLRKPFTRYLEDGEEVQKNSENSVTGSILWEDTQNGLRFPRLSVLNGEIFPACFLDTEGNPISTPVCVVLENLKWEKGRRCRCTIKVVLDEVPEEGLFCRGNRFYLYHNRKKIAEGEIT